MKHKFALFCTVVLLLSLLACKKTNGGTDSIDTSSTTSIPDDLVATEMFSDRDKEIGYNENNCVKITLKGSSAECADKTVSIDGSTITVTGEGDYLFSGSLDNGQIIVNTDKTAKTHLIFNDVDINCDTSAALYIKQADKVFITLADNTVNKLTNKNDFVAIDDNKIDAVIFSKEDVTFNGLGALKINAAYGHGIVSKDDLVITGGNYSITAASHGITGKDSIRIADGNFNVVSGKDALHAENSDDTALGYMYIGGGTFDLTAETDGLDAASVLKIDAGTFDIVSGGGSVNSSTSSDGSFNPDWGNWGGGFFGRGMATSGASETDKTSSAKGIKSGGNLIINNGTVSIVSSDDALHSNASLSINGGSFTVTSGDDGIHADAQTVITSGEITITKSYEGIEGQSIEITGGTVTVTASDDGLNAAGGNDQSGLNDRPGMGRFAEDLDSFITISGGKLLIDASGDGIDSNGALTVTGGETYISGPTNSGNGALDYAGNATISGGVFVATGESGMAQNFSSANGQGAMLVSGSGSAGGTVTVKDSNGNTILSYSPLKTYSCVVISSPDIQKGNTYMVQIGESTQTVEMTSNIYGTSGGMGGGFPGNMPGGQKPNHGTPMR